MAEKTITIVLWGDSQQKKNWLEWYLDMKDLFQNLGYPVTHIGIDSEFFHSGKVLTVSRKEKDILEHLKNGELPEDMSCFSLPKGYRTACFDFNLECVREGTYLAAVMKEKDYSETKESMFLSAMKKYIVFDHGEIFASSAEEVSLLYAAIEDADNLRSYQFLKRIEL